MLNITDQLSFIETAAQSFLSADNARNVDHDIATIRKKANDPMLYLAVVGEFSSGKSTFINALLGFRLLKEAVMPTTACATYIRRCGKEMKINVRFFDGQSFICTEQNIGNLPTYLRLKLKVEATTMPQIIEALTSVQDVACTVERLHIDVPQAKIPAHVVIIDTPGFNPGAATVGNHVEITRHVVEHVADAALVLTPQEQAMSATLINFLQENLERCLHRCFYVVTKMDNSQPIHRSTILDFARQRLTSDLGLNHPELSAQSAITRLPVKCIPPDKEADWKKFSEDFELFTHRLWQKLEQNKEIVISEHVLTLLTRATKDITAMLRKKNEELSENMKFLRSNRVENIRTVTNSMVSEVGTNIDRMLAEVTPSSLLSEYQQKSYTEMKEILNSEILSLDTFRNKMMGRIEKGVNKQAAEGLVKVNNIINSLVRNCMKEQVNKMTNVFASHYKQFPTLHPRNSAPRTDLVQMELPDFSFSVALSKIEALQKEEDKNGKIGAGGGAAAGFMVGGPFGALVGAGIGWLAGHIVGDKSDKMKAEALQVLENEIATFFSAICNRIEDEKENVRKKYMNVVNTFAQRHISEYGQAVADIIKNHEEQEKALKRKIGSLKTTTRSLEQMYDDLLFQLQGLKIQQ